MELVWNWYGTGAGEQPRRTGRALLPRRVRQPGQVGQAGPQGEAVTSDDLVNEARPQHRVPGHIQPPHLHKGCVEAPLSHPVQLGPTERRLNIYIP